MHTAVCVFKFIDEGILCLEDKVTKYFPEYAKAGDMTIFDLLHMRSGILDFANDAETFFGSEELVEALDDGKITDEIFLECLYRLDLTFVPGAKMNCCNTNYVLLAMILEKITGKAYKEIVLETIFDPVGMTASSATTFGDVTSVPESKAGYMKELIAARGAGDIHSNALDLLRFDRAFFNGQSIVSPAAKAGILNFVDNYGCGWEKSTRHEDLVTHDGGTNSYFCMNIVFHASADRKYLIMLTCCNEDDEEETDETAGETKALNEEEEFDQYQTVFDICKKHLQ
jgi:CubicO group peptidase (beta-lactamase class C family)